MDLATIETNLAAIFVSTTGLKAKWAIRPHDWIGPDAGTTPLAYGLLHLRSSKGQGHDALDWTYDDTAVQGSEMTPHSKGNREIVWEVQIRTLSGYVGLNAIHYAELLRDSLRFPSVETLLDGAGIGVQAVALLRDHTVTLPGRMESAATLEIVFNADSDLAGPAIGYVETFELEGTADDQTGAGEVVFDGLVPS